MPKKYVVVFKSIGRKWFFFLIIIILLIFVYNQEAAIWITGIAIVLFAVTYIRPTIFMSKFNRLVKDYYMIEDDSIAQEMKKPVSIIRAKMFNIIQRQQNKKKWQFWIRIKKSLIVFLNKRYIYYHRITIEKFLELYHKGYEEKEILEELRESDLRTKAEVKAIGEGLRKVNRLGVRRISVKERQEKGRFS